MMRLALACVAFCAAVSLANAGAYTGSIPPHAKIKTIGIISAIGDTLMFEHVRASTLEWMGPPDASFLEIADWGIDDLVTRETTAALAKRFAIKPVTYEEADFDSWTYKTLARDIRELPLPDDDIDAYVVIVRDWRHDEIGDSVHQVAGLGLYRRDAGGSERVGAYASYRIVIVDARNYEIIASRAALLPDGKLPWVQLSPLLWPKTQNDLTDAQSKTLQSDVTRLLYETLAPTLRKMGVPQ
jgi:hypothetical protein